VSTTKQIINAEKNTDDGGKAMYEELRDIQMNEQQVKHMCERSDNRGH